MKFNQYMVLCLFCQVYFITNAQVLPAPDRAEGIGPFPQLIIRGATLINGTGSPPFGPVDIVIEHNRIVKNDFF